MRLNVSRIWQKAKDTLNRFIGEKIVTLLIFGEDKYKRKIAKVIHNDKYINLLIVRCGYAWYYEEYAPDKDLAIAEKKAREQLTDFVERKHI